MDIQEAVNNSMNAGVDNGYEEFVKTENPAILAVDMVDYDKDIASIVELEFSGDETGLIPYIKAWQIAQCTA